MIFKRRSKADPASAIEAFWQWWATARPRVEQAIADGNWDGDIVEAMSDRIDAINPGLAWEFGSGTTSQHLLVVTSSGDRTLRPVAERWRRAGPPPDEIFGYAASRQPTPAALDAKLDIDGRQLELDALRFAAEVDEPAAQVDVQVWHPAFADLPEQARVQVAFLSLDWLLGEDGVEIWVREIKTVAESGPSLTAAQLAEAVAALSSAGGEPRWAVLGGIRDRRPTTATVQVPLKPARWPAADTHVRLSVPFRAANTDGFPVDDSLAALRALEDRIIAYADGPALVAHETTRGVRTYHLYADRPAAVSALEPIVASWPEGRVRMAVTPDPSWKGVRHLLP